ncbi:MAG: VOC family protein [Candidatus Eisenbacteria bacterium]|nr:VOC family protein [Candidatus Eisenbacteria bacterium]
MFSDLITFCSTTDLEATTRFYGEILSMPMVLDQGRCRIWRAAGQGYVGFCRRDSVPAQGIILTLVSDDVDGWHRRLLEHGVPIDKAPAFNPEYGIYHLFCRDPNGYLVEIQRFEDPEWNQGTP